jgi:hypothetical protein
VGDVGEERAERADELHAERLGEIEDQRGEGAPARRGLGAAQQHEVARRARHARDEDLDGRPDDLAHAGGPGLDLRAHRLEVIELLGVDLREARGAERGADEGQRRGGGVARVVPASERADQGRGPQSVGAVVPNQRLHPLHRTS